MKNIKIEIIVFSFCLCFFMMTYRVMAVSTSIADEAIVPERECSLTISYCCGETALSGVDVKIYRVADVLADFKYTLTKSFKSSGLALDGIRTNGEWSVVRFTLETHILAHNVEPDFTVITNAEGQARLDSLRTGMYLATVDSVEQNDLFYEFDSALIALPCLENDGQWQYQAQVNAKGEALPAVDTDGETEFKIIKLWRGDENSNNRPQNVEVEIFCDGKSYKTVVLSDENNWMYNWIVKDDTSKWAVVERNVPQGYTMTVEERQTTFILTNTWIPQNPDVPGNPSQTGDTSNVLIYAFVMIAAGIVLIILGIQGKKSRV